MDALVQHGYRPVDRSHQKARGRRRRWSATLQDTSAPIWDRVHAATLLGLKRTAWRLVRDYIHSDSNPVEERVSFALDFGYTIKRKAGKVIFHHRLGDRHLARTESR